MRISDWSSDVCSSDLLAEGRRVPIATPALSGSINLVGARIDDVTLTNYRQTIDTDSPPVRLFAPAGTSAAYFASLGWSVQGVEAPDPATVWTPSGSKPTGRASWRARVCKYV